jgi:hypothetical protein
MKNLIKGFALLISVLVLFRGIAIAEWPVKSDSAVAVVTETGNQWNVRLASDQKNGALLVWQDRRGGNTDKLYVQRIDASGQAVWQSQGIRLTSTEGYQYYPQIISDGKYGAYIVWQDNRSGSDYDIYVQHIDANGISTWTKNGVLVCGATGQQYYPQIVNDGSGGIIITWQDRRNGQYDIYTQRYDSLGNAQWEGSGLPVCSEITDQIEPKLINDYRSGAIISWTDFRSGSTAPDIYCQRVLSTGTLAWKVNGVAVCTAQGSQLSSQISPDSTGGAIIAWQDRRNLTYDNIYAQRIDAYGVPKWATNGIQIAQSPGTQYYPQMASDKSGGAFIVWQDNRRGTEYDIYGQRVSREGVLLWASTGFGICTAVGNQYNPQMYASNTSCVVTWQDRRGANYDIYAQRLNKNSQPLWAADGIRLTSLAMDQFLPQLTSDSIDGAIVAWPDYHLNTGSTDIFTQRVGANGSIAGGMFRTFTQDSFALAAKRFKNYRKQISSMPNSGNVRDSVILRGAFPYGVVLGIEKPDAKRTYGWIRYTRAYYIRRAFPQTWPARGFDWYFDKMAFIGEKRNLLPTRYSNQLAGELLALKINIGASDVGITPTGFGDLVFSDTLGVVNPLNGRKLRQITTLVDSMLTLWRNYSSYNYAQVCNGLQRINSAFNGKFDTLSTSPLQIVPVRSLFSVPFLRPSIQTLAEEEDLDDQIIPLSGEGIPQNFVLHQNYPNPFNPFTMIEFSIPEQSVVSMKIFNVLGQEISAPLDRVLMEADHQLVDFNGSNLPSGVYFYQIIAEPTSGNTVFNEVKKMMLLK